MYEPSKYKNYIYSGKLGGRISDYITEKRASGCLYNTEAKKLSEFSRMSLGFEFPDGTLTKEVVEAWIKRRDNDADKTVYSRFGVIKGFAEYLRRQGLDAFVPSSADLPKLNTHGYVPHIFTHEEILRFFAVYGNSVSTGCRSAYTERFRAMMRMVFELLYCCGLRVSEAIGLTINDVDFGSNVLTIRFAKFEKSRYVPMAADLADDLAAYVSTYVHEPCLFPGNKGQHLAGKSVYEEFRRVLFLAGIPHHGRGRGPRVHDFRHTFACHCLQKWIRSGTPVSSALPRLSTYLGHNDMAATEKYLRMAAEVYPEISEKLSKDYGYLIPLEVQQ